MHHLRSAYKMLVGYVQAKKLHRFGNLLVNGRRLRSWLYENYDMKIWTGDNQAEVTGHWRVL